jgi:hypothetical protein
MGAICSGSVVIKAEQDENTAEVDRQLKEAEELASRNYKILLLGAGEAGKSTVVKQIKMIYKAMTPPVPPLPSTHTPYVIIHLLKRAHTFVGWHSTTRKE